MIEFDQFLIEMGIDTARETLGLPSDYDEKTLKTAFRRASSKNHPDKGGSNEAMKKVNAAYAKLKGTVGKQTDTDNRSAHVKTMGDMSLMIIKDLVKNFKVDIYTKHFETVFGEPFKALVVKAYPTEQDINKQRDARYSTYPSHVFYTVKWSNTTDTKVFELDLMVSMTTLANSGGLASPGTTYDMGVSTFGYTNSRKVKITARDFGFSSKKSLFNTPESIFPRKKIDKAKKKKTKFKKSDMLAALTREVKAEVSGDFYFLPLSDKSYLAISRMTMMRQGLWQVVGVWEKEKGRWKRHPKYDKSFGVYSFIEDEHSLDLFRGTKKQNAGNIEKYIKTEYTNLKNNK